MKVSMVLLCFFLILISGCSTSKSAMDDASKGNEQIPSSFNPAVGILLIESAIDEDASTVNVSTTTSYRSDTYTNAFMRKNHKNMVEYADKNFQHKHEFATQNEIYNGDSKYSDKTLYRFALVTSLVKPVQIDKLDTRSGQIESTHNQPIFRFYLYDRLNDKTYSSLGNGSSLIMWAFKSAINKLNGAR